MRKLSHRNPDALSEMVKGIKGPTARDGPADVLVVGHAAHIPNQLVLHKYGCGYRNIRQMRTAIVRIIKDVEVTVRSYLGGEGLCEPPANRMQGPEKNGDGASLSHGVAPRIKDGASSVSPPPSRW